MATTQSPPIQAPPRPTLVVVADFLRSKLFTAIAGGLIIVLALITLGFALFGTWLETPPVDREHQEHIRITEPSNTVRRSVGFRDNDILVRLAGIVATDKTDAELAEIYANAKRASHTAALAEFYAEVGPHPAPTENAIVNISQLRAYWQRYYAILADAEFVVVASVQRAGRMVEVEIDDDLMLTDPAMTEYERWEDYDMVLERRPDQGLSDPSGKSISLITIWLGSDDTLPTLDLTRLADGESGFGSVRALDRLLILYPLGLLLVIGLIAGWMWMRWNGKTDNFTRGLQVEPIYWRKYKITPDRLLNLAVLVVILLVIFPAIWGYYNNLNWRGDLQGNYAETTDVDALPDVYLDVFHVRELVILSDVTRTSDFDLSIVRQTLLEIRNSLATNQLWNWTIAVAVMAIVLRILTYSEADGLITNPDRMMAVLVLSPSLILLGIFVYGFIAQNVEYSLTDWGEESKGAPSALSAEITRVNIGTENYSDLMTDGSQAAFRNSLVNTFFFTILFLGGALFMGFLLAFLVDQRVKGEGLFRTVFLFPMSLSLVVTGTVWNWLLQPKGGLNQLPEIISEGEILGVRVVPSFLRSEALTYQWISSRNTLYQFSWDEAQAFVYLGLALFGVVVFNWAVRSTQRTMMWTSLAALGLWLAYVMGLWDNIWPPLDDPGTEPIKGYNVALTGAILAATWQMSGYVMALFLAGIRGVSEELREAARVDGCAEWQVYLFIILPSLRPVILSAVIILGHISLKVFDLIFALAGNPDNAALQVPGLILYTTAFRANRLATGSAVAVIMLVLVSLVIVPYLWSNIRQQRSEAH